MNKFFVKMAKQEDDNTYCSLLSELVENCEKELEEKILEFNGYKKVKEEEVKARMEALKAHYDQQLQKIRETYETLMEETRKELDGYVEQHFAGMEEMFELKMNEVLEIKEMSYQAEVNKLAMENADLELKLEREWFQVENLKKELWKIDVDIERESKMLEDNDGGIVFLQANVEQIEKKNEEIIQLHDRLSQNLQNKISLMEDDIKRMKQLCNCLQGDDVSNVKSIDGEKKSDNVNESRLSIADDSLDHQAMSSA